MWSTSRRGTSALSSPPKRPAPFRVRLGLLAFLFLVCGCAQTYHLQKPISEIKLPPNAKVLLMPPDIQLFEITAGGLHQPKADWTEAAKIHMHQALETLLKSREDTILVYQPPHQDPAAEHAHGQLIKLHEMVGRTILVHKYIEALKLPTQKDKMTYSLGTGVQSLRAAQAADCALFIFLRDSYASAGRVAVIAAGAVMGFYIPGGVQLGFASLVDLNSGEIIWFNRLLRESGDLRTPEPAGEAVGQLLSGIPL
jgi:hypothetical protein